MPWHSLLTQLGGVAALAAIFAWLLRTLLQHLLSKDIEVFKVRLADESALGIEQLKVQLQIAAGEHGIRFGALHQRRADIIADLYHQLSGLTIDAWLLARLVRLREAGEVDEERVRHATAELAKNSSALFQFIQRNQLYFGPELAERLRKAFFAMNQPLPDLTLSDAAEAAGKVTDSATRRANFVAYWEEKGSEISSLLGHIEADFRRLLGSED